MLPEILSILFEKNPSVRIVVTAILLETALQACESLEAFTLKPGRNHAASGFAVEKGRKRSYALRQ